MHRFDKTSLYPAIACALCTFFVLFLYSWFKSSKGIDFTDESNYFYAAYRVWQSHGDPTADLTVPYSLYHFFIHFIFYIIPDFSIRHSRLIAMTWQSMALSLFAGCAVQYLKSSPFFIFLLCITAFFYNSFQFIPSLSYNSISSICLLTTLTILCFARRPQLSWQQIVLASIAAIFYAVGILSAPQLLLTVPVFIFDIFFSKKFNYSKNFTLIFLGVTIFICLSAIIWVFNQGYEALYINSDFFNHKIDLFKYFTISRKLYKLTPFSSYILMGFIIMCLLRLKKYKFSPQILVYTIPIFIVLFIYEIQIAHLTLNNIHTYISGIIIYIFISIGLYFLTIFTINNLQTFYSIYISGAVSIIAIFAYAFGTFSISVQQAFLTGLNGSSFIFLILWACMESKYQKIISIRIIITSSLLVLCCFTGYHHLIYSFRESTIWNLTEPLQQYGIKGLYTTPERAKTLNEVSFFFKDKIHPGDILLTNGFISVINLITQTASPLPISYTHHLFFTYGTPYNPGGAMLIEKQLSQWKQANKIPLYVVRESIEPMEGAEPRDLPLNQKNPLDLFLINYYQLETSIGFFDIYKKK